MIWILLVVFQFKHFLADYPLQTPYMLGKFKDKGWVLPLAAHCGVHFLFTSIIAYFVTGCYIYPILLGLLDFSIHFVMDRIKASSKLLGRFKALSAIEFVPVMTAANYTSNFSDLVRRKEYAKRKLRSNTLFWWSLGFDQMVHHLTDILIVYLLVVL